MATDQAPPRQRESAFAADVSFDGAWFHPFSGDIDATQRGDFPSFDCLSISVWQWHDWHDVTAQITRFGSSRNQFFQQPIRVESCWITTVSGWSCAPVRLIHPAPETEGLHPRLHDVSHRCREEMWSDCGLVGNRSMAVTIWGCEHELCWKRGCQEGDLPLARHVFVS